jgi:ABC-2 type transport system ATP-binding protein
MDVGSRRSLWEVIRDCAQRGVAILLTTHYLEEADALANRVVVLKHGRVVADDTPARLRSSVATQELRCRTTLTPERLTALPGVRSVSTAPPDAWLSCSDADAALRALVAADPRASHFEIVTPKLEEVFLSLTTDGEPAPDGPARRQR